MKLENAKLLKLEISDLIKNKIQIAFQGHKQNLKWVPLEHKQRDTESEREREGQQMRLCYTKINNGTNYAKIS